MQLLPSLAVVVACICFPTVSKSSPHDSCAVIPQDAVSLLQLPTNAKILGASRAKSEQSPPSDTYPWARRGRDAAMSSSTPYTAPSNFSVGPTWVWKNELDEEVRHSPLIDNNLNIYVTTATRIRKFSKHGKILWTWQSSPHDGKMASGPALYKGAIFAVTTGNISMYSIDMANGTVIWKKTPDLGQHDDCSGVFVYNDTMIIPLMNNTAEGNNKLHAVNSSDGSRLWDYNADDVFWNFAPATPGDGSLLFGASCGGVYRLNFGGELIWRKGSPGPESGSNGCSTGGGSLGPNGLFYIEYNDGLTVKNGAHIMAYNVSNGALVWKRTLKAPFGGWQYPAVGKIGSNGTLAVVVAAGGITAPPHTHDAEWLEKPVSKAHPLRNMVMAMDAASGKVLWQSEEDPWDRPSAAGDDEKFLERKAQAELDPRRDIACAPDIQGIPVIAGDGTVYASSGHTGDIRAIKDVDGNGIIDLEEVSVFSTHMCFLNSPSVAPGMLVAAPCWGPMYVFKADSE